MKRKARKGLFEVAVVIAIAFVGAVAVAKSLLTPPDVHYSKYAVKDLKRMPASVEGNNSRQPLLAVSTLHLECLNEESAKKLKVNSRQVRLLKKLCQDDFEAINIAVENKSNGHHATVFPESESFQTDYIHLNPGENTIKITLDRKSGETKEIKLLVLNAI